MSNHPKLESYLSALEKALSKISVGERSEIILEIKSHVMDMNEKHPEQTIEQILGSLGEPEVVANRYLLERGIQTSKPRNWNMAKWLTVGFLGTVSIFIISISLLVWKFTPIIKIDEKEGRVVLLGGLMDISSNDVYSKLKKGKFKFDSSTFSTWEDGDHGWRFQGSKMLDSKVKNILIPFKNGQIDVSSTLGKEISWDCRGRGVQRANIKEAVESFSLDLGEDVAVKCDVTLPRKIGLKIKGSNGKLTLSELLNPIDVSLSNGKVDFLGAKEAKYKFELSVSNGKIDEFPSSSDPQSMLVKINLSNGVISNEGL